MDAIILWHVHAANGQCHGCTPNYDIAFAVCIQLYRQCGSNLSFFVTDNPYAKLSTEPQTNS